MKSPASAPTSIRGRRSREILAALLGVIALVACSQTDHAGADQVVAKVNKEEITESQVDQLLERQHGLKPDQMNAAGARIVGALVDQEILFQKARELKLDRDPLVALAVEAAKREVVARAYVDHVALAASAPSDADIRAYYDAKPSLFSRRRIYSLEELTIESSADQRAQLQGDLKAMKTPTELATYIRERGLRVHTERSTLGAENLPLVLVDRLASMEPGNSLVLPVADGVRVIYVTAALDAPATIEQARPAIETFLLSDRKRQTVEREIQSLRAEASVEYLGKYKALASNEPAVPSTVTVQP